VLVSEEELRQAIVLMLEMTHNLAEGAGAASLAAAVKIKERLAGRNVALVLSGGNLSTEKLRWALAGATP
jgi:threonine dehydratase